MKGTLITAALALALGACGAADDKAAPDAKAVAATPEAQELRDANAHCREMVDIADIEAANPLCLSALEDARKYDEASPEYARAVANTAWLFHMRGDDSDAQQFYRRAVELQEPLEEPRALARTLADYGMLLTNNGDAENGLKHLERAGALLRADGAERSEAMAALYGDMAESYEIAGDDEGALRMYRKSVEAYRKALGEQHANVGVALNNLGTALQAQDRFDAAGDVLEDAVAVLDEALGSEHPVAGMARSNLGDNDKLREDAEARARMEEEAEEARAGPDTGST